MSEFFESDIVRGELEEIERLQSEIHGDLFAFPALPHDEQKEHLVNLVALVEKQRVLYTRICLSEDEDAKAMKEKIEQSALMM